MNLSLFRSNDVTKICIVLVLGCVFFLPVMSHADSDGGGGAAGPGGPVGSTGHSPGTAAANSDSSFGGMVDSAIGAIGDAASAVGDAVGDAASAVGDALGISASDFGLADNDATAADIGATTGPADTSDVSAENDGAGGGSFGSSKRITPPPPAEIERAAEIQPIVGSAFTVSGVTTFTGSIINTGNTVATALNVNDRKITTNLFIDYNCDGSVDKRQLFDTDFTTLRTGRANIPLEVTETGIPNGDHCFGFAIDRGQKYTDKDRSNNRSVTENFAIANFTDLIADDTTQPDQTDQISSADGGSQTSDTDTTIDTGSTVAEPTITAPPFLFQLRTRKVADETTGQLMTVTDWTSSGITIREDEIIAARWDAPDYDFCFPFVHYSSGFVSDIAAGATSANTEVAGVALDKVNGTYRVQCETDDGLTTEQTIPVTVIKDPA